MIAIISIGSEMLRWQVISTIFAGIVLLLTVLFQATADIFSTVLALFLLKKQGHLIECLFFHLINFSSVAEPSRSAGQSDLP